MFFWKKKRKPTESQSPELKEENALTDAPESIADASEVIADTTEVIADASENMEPGIQEIEKEEAQQSEEAAQEMEEAAVSSNPNVPKRVKWKNTFKIYILDFYILEKFLGT
ncbi:MAG: hypothetical protein K2K64_11420, partial [Muribaculaceae bacterium]|nr:hypothetical protein [Muribaculaceae bacterium]